MWNRVGNRSSALERAKAQLSGQRINTIVTPKDNARRDVANLGKGLLQSRQTPLHGLSDLSSEDADSEHQDHHGGPACLAKPPEQFGVGGGSRFLKKSAHSAAADGQLSAPTRTSADASDLKLIPQRSSQSVALSRLALIEDRFRNQKNKRSVPDTVPDTGPDLPLPQESVQSSSDLSMTGSRFLKKKASTTVHLKEHNSIPLGSYRTSQLMGRGLDSDEEDMRRILGESLDSPDGSLTKVLRQSPQMAAKTYRKDKEKAPSLPFPSAKEHKEHVPPSSAFTAHRHYSPSPSPPSSPKALSASRSVSRGPKVNLLSLSSASGQSEIKSLEELFPVASNHDDDDDDNTLSEKSVLSDDFKINIMTLDDLAPVTLGTAELPKQKTEESPVAFTELSPSPANESSHNDRPAPEEVSAQYESDFDSEVQTETAVSADEISEHFSDGDKPSIVATDPQSHSYSVDDHTLSEESPKSTGVQYSKSESSLSHSRSSPSDSYSSDDTITPSKPQSQSVRRRPVKDATVQTQRDALTYSWSTGPAVLGPSIGMSYVDPTPIASHTVSAEAVEALSAYSPAVFALNDMLKQQLALTRSFIESSRYLHHTMVESLGPADYRYTTLEDTKEFIRCHRAPKLTVEDALEEVLKEMREYHYI
uniref:Chromosome 5 C19orf44 homolog n=1 Tax=Astyanax mexicanus TaxID=7994 RepID=W5LQI7_ASTMX